jgi:DNA-directed RNA polymerase subunit M/transcription elongation factor TFIIS
MAEAIAVRRRKVVQRFRSQMVARPEHGATATTVNATRALATALEARCYQLALDRCCARDGFATARSQCFTAPYNQLVLQIGESLAERDVAVADVGAPPEVLVPDVMAPYVTEANRRRTACVQGRDSRFARCKCGSKKVEYTEIQTGGADEVMSYLYTCNTCGQTWRR